MLSPGVAGEGTEKRHVMSSRPLVLQFLSTWTGDGEIRKGWRSYQPGWKLRPEHSKTGTLPVSLGDEGVPGKYPRTGRESVAKPKKIISRIQRVVSAEACGSMQGVCDPSPQVE